MTYPLLPPTRRNKISNTKIDPLLKQAIFTSKRAIFIGGFISIDDQITVIQGKNKYKLRITYKKEGCGFQCDALCADGFTYILYFRNQPPPSDNMPCDLSDQHRRFISLINQLKGENYACDMDNLYMYVRLEKVCKTRNYKTTTCVKKLENKT